MLSLLGVIEQCLKAGKKQTWHAASVTNICVGLLAGFKVLIISSSNMSWGLALSSDLMIDSHSLFHPQLRLCFFFIP